MTLRLMCLAAAFAALSAAPSLTVAAEAASPLGSWQLSSGESRYSVVQCDGGAICAKLVWLRDDARTAENLALLNTYVVKGQPVRNNKWKGKAVYEGKTVDASMTMVNADTMKLTGCQVLCQTMTLSRVGAEVASR